MPAEPGSTWRDRAGLLILDPEDPRGDPIETPTDRRWLHRIEGFLSVSATNETQRQVAADLRAYLYETCAHHWLHYSGSDDEIPEHWQCLCGAARLSGPIRRRRSRREVPEMAGEMALDSPRVHRPAAA